MYTFSFFSVIDLHYAANFLGLSAASDMNTADCLLFVEGDMYRDSLSRELDRKRIQYGVSFSQDEQQSLFSSLEVIPKTTNAVHILPESLDVVFKALIDTFITERCKLTGSVDSTIDYTRLVVHLRSYLASLFSEVPYNGSQLMEMFFELYINRLKKENRGLAIDILVESAKTSDYFYGVELK
ncbi:hypothetical protein [Chroococcidiopsis sp.]|uniref:hypothetical protein n=1 Tax=Chroococcidiopsis sp. TaxID=3088168 RepID=UPI003F2FB4DB